MISLKRHIDAYGKSVTDSWRTAYGSALAAISKTAGNAVPTLANNLEQSLSGIGERVESATSSSEIASIAQDLEGMLAGWGKNAASNSEEILEHLREIVTAVATSASALADRDQQYKNRFAELTESLHSISRLDDLKTMRQSVVQSANEIKVCAEKMVKEGEHSVTQLRAEIAQYRSRISEYRKSSSVDPLTGIANRVAIDQRIADRISHASVFCVILIDLNGFKTLNDTHGHTAGDDLLKQFASEMAGLFRASDVVGRWGGDEFVAVVDTSLTEAGGLANLVRKWAFGSYKVTGPAEPITLDVTGAIGVAAWNGRESAVELFNRADQGMYVDKENVRKAKTANAVLASPARTARV